jgi:hypothetical protein
MWKCAWITDPRNYEFYTVIGPDSSASRVVSRTVEEHYVVAHGLHQYQSSNCSAADHC